MGIVLATAIIAGAAVGTAAVGGVGSQLTEDFERTEELSRARTDLIVIDTAHGHTQKVLNMSRNI